jgi:methylated-DNA-[protein]-cysteine S-methyltransferase
MVVPIATAIAGCTWHSVESPLGLIWLRFQDDDSLTGLYFAGQKYFPGNVTQELSSEPSDLAQQTAEQLKEYFCGVRPLFDIPFRLIGSPFQQRVWSALCSIPYGQSTTYGQLAERLGDPKSARAVGTAIGRNPISLIVPCHRVIGTSGSLTGYAGGLDRKRWLLTHESREPSQRRLRG